jgi:hypothetical protein
MTFRGGLLFITTLFVTVIDPVLIVILFSIASCVVDCIRRFEQIRLPPLTAIVRSSPALPILVPEKIFTESTTVSVYVALKTIEMSSFPPSSVKLLQSASALIKIRLFVGIITSWEEVGTEPRDQFVLTPHEPAPIKLQVFVCAVDIVYPKHRKSNPMNRYFHTNGRRPSP